MSGNFQMDGYVDVAERIAIFRSKYPEGSLQPHNLDEPLRVMTMGDKTFLLYVAAAYRTPDDQRPGIGIAWEPFPGKTPYTRDSEAMVAETSAWGRAIVAALAADTKKGIASAEEVRNRRADEEVRRPDPVDPEKLSRSKPKAPQVDEWSTPDPLADIKRKVWDAANKVGIADKELLAADYAQYTQGMLLSDAKDFELQAYLAHLEAEAKKAEQGVLT